MTSYEIKEKIKQEKSRLAYLETEVERVKAQIDSYRIALSIAEQEEKTFKVRPVKKRRSIINRTFAIVVYSGAYETKMVKGLYDALTEYRETISANKWKYVTLSTLKKGAKEVSADTIDECILTHDEFSKSVFVCETLRDGLYYIFGIQKPEDAEDLGIPAKVYKLDCDSDLFYMTEEEQAESDEFWADYLGDLVLRVGNSDWE